MYDLNPFPCYYIVQQYIRHTYFESRNIDDAHSSNRVCMVIIK